MTDNYQFFTIHDGRSLKGIDHNTYLPMCLNDLISLKLLSMNVVNFSRLS